MPQLPIAVNYVLAIILALPAPFPSLAPWNKAPQKWSLSETYKILRDSPWSPAKVQIETKYTQHFKDPVTSTYSESPVHTNLTGPIPGVEVSWSTPLPSVPVLWRSSKTVRLAEQRLAQLRNPASSGVALQAEPLTDYVIALEGEEPMRILRDPAEDLHKTVFLELDNGMPLDFTDVTFVKATDLAPARTEFHFPRKKNGQPTIDIHAERVIFHCRATAKVRLEGRDNAIALRAEFSPKKMRVRKTPDL